MKTPINLWLDDVRTPPRPREEQTRTILYGFHFALSAFVDWIWCIDAPSAVMMTLKHDVINMSLDHDLGDGPTGYDFVKWMGETGNWPKYKPNVHSQNPVGAANMRAYIDRYWRR